MSDVSEVLDRFRGLSVLVIGEAMLDTYLDGSATRICREAPVPIVDVLDRRDCPGGAANAAVNAAALGANVRLISVVGHDPEAKLLVQRLQRFGVSVDDVRFDGGRRTLSKTRVSAGGQLVARLDSGSKEDVDTEGKQWLFGRLSRLFAAADVVIVSDYGYGIMTPSVIAELACQQALYSKTLVVDSKNLRAYRLAEPTAVKPNRAEAAELLGVPCPALAGPPSPRLMCSADELLDLTGAKIVAVTLDVDGSVLLRRDAPARQTITTPTDHSFAVGAGDTYLVALALALGAGATPDLAASLASSACSVVVASEGTVACSLAELRRANGGDTVVMASGCFDLLHPGHVDLLTRAKALGDVLVVGLNSDASVARLKGPDRPVMCQADRVAMLEALECVDQVVVFDEPDPCDLVRRLRPDVVVKGSDYSRESMPEAEVVEGYGGRVAIVPMLEGYSTTSIVGRISPNPEAAHVQEEAAITA